VQLKSPQRVDSTRKVLFLISRIRVESTIVWLNENKNNNEKKNKKLSTTLVPVVKFMCMYYFLIKVIFWMLMLGFKLMILGLCNKLIFRSIMKKCVAYPQEDFLFIKLITSLRISLLNNYKKRLPVYIKSSPNTLKLVNISRESEKGAKNSYGRRNLFPKSKNQ
jgi:hypothetical protein